MTDRSNLTQAVSTVASDATRQIHAEQKLVELNRIVSLTAAVGAALNQGDSLKSLLQSCLEAIVTHLDVACACLWTLTDNILEIQASAGACSTPACDFKIERIAQDRCAHLSNDLIGEPDFQDHKWTRREGIVAVAGNPLVIENRVIGVLSVFSRRPYSDTVAAALAS